MLCCALLWQGCEESDVYALLSAAPVREQIDLLLSNLVHGQQNPTKNNDNDDSDN